MTLKTRLEDIADIYLHDMQTECEHCVLLQMILDFTQMLMTVKEGDRERLILHVNQIPTPQNQKEELHKQLVGHLMDKLPEIWLDMEVLDGS